jgi:hypothetical protein
MIGFYDLTEDEYFITESAAKSGVTYENTSAPSPSSSSATSARR